ncbi:hypothetical protein WN943_008797 [Citrus x changshan-huyou]
MAFSLVLKLLLVVSMIITVKARYDEASFPLMSTEGHGWASWTISAYDDDDDDEEERQDEDGGIARRSLYRRGKHYYISYGALSANRVPCPARSGRSYYTHNCYKARGHANPYTRGCSTITHCRR